MSEGQDYIALMNQSIKGLFRDALRIVWKRPALGWFVWRTIRNQKRAARRREQWEKNGVHVPPFMIASITHQCNLHCKGCYARAQRRNTASEMSEEQLRKLVREGRELGISLMLIAGGEPLVRPEILQIAGEARDVIFPIFTNGMLITQEMISQMRRQKNVIPVLSLEGYGEETDERRGQGVFEQLEKVTSWLKTADVFFGVSLTLTRENYNALTGDRFVQNLLNAGCKLFFFVEYVPVQAGTEELVLTDEQRVGVLAVMDRLRSTYRGLFIAFPGDEEAFGGCLSAGRGFVHVSPEGNLEPCPFAPYSDTNLREMSLKDALESRFLREIRNNHELLSETEGGCALWVKREWVQRLLQSTTDTSTTEHSVGE